MPDFHLPEPAATAHVDDVGKSGLVSVVVPIYNHARFVGQLLDSIAREDHSDIEVIAIDDGSNDDSFQVAATWREANPAAFSQFVLLRQPNMGLNKTLNRLIGLSSGEYIVPIASDDLLLKGGIASRVAELREHPEWRALFADCMVIDADGQELAPSMLDKSGADRKALSNPETLGTELVWNFIAPAASMMARRTAYFGEGSLGLYPEDLLFEDRDFFLRLLAQNALGFLDRRVAAYRRHGSNFMDFRDDEHARRFYEAHVLSHSKNIHLFSGVQRLGLWFECTTGAAEARFRTTRTFRRRFEKKLVWELRKTTKRMVRAYNSHLARRG